MKMRWLILPLLLVTGSALADTTTFQQGTNYLPMTPAQPVDVAPGQVEVIEFFWYGCPHCYALEPYLEAWLKHKPKNVVFKRIPVAQPWGEQMDIDGHAYFTAQVLGIGDKIHEPFFDAIHKNGQPELRNDVDAIRSFFGKFGVSGKDFDAAWGSFGVQAKLSQAANLEQRYGLEGVPTLVINGKWKTGAGYQMTNADTMKCVQFLVDMESAAASKKK